MDDRQRIFWRNLEWQLVQSCKIMCTKCSAGSVAGSGSAALVRFPSRLPPSIIVPGPIRISALICGGAFAASLASAVVSVAMW